jgi:hypothetical protein
MPSNVKETTQKLSLMGRTRKVYLCDGEKKVMYKGRMIKLETARKWDASKKAAAKKTAPKKK